FNAMAAYIRNQREGLQYRVSNTPDNPTHAIGLPGSGRWPMPSWVPMKWGGSRPSTTFHAVFFARTKLLPWLCICSDPMLHTLDQFWVGKNTDVSGRETLNVRQRGCLRSTTTNKG